MYRKIHRLTAIGLVLLLVGLTGCQTLRELANLRLVEFGISGVSEAYLAGIDLDRVRSYQDLNATDLARIGTALTRRTLPFEFDLHLSALNPQENDVQARLVAMEWTLFLEDRETVSGLFEDQVLLPPGRETDIPIHIGLDLVPFFDENMRDLVDLALAVSGQGGSPKRVHLEATPIIETVLGPVRYPEPITIVSRTVGS